MSGMLSKSLPLSSNFTMDEEAKLASEKQGIISILGSDSVKTNVTTPLRRTLSADMSSKKWLAQNGFSSMKKISSSQELLASIDDSSSSDEEDSDEKERLQIWNSIQEGKVNKPEKANELTSWISLLTQKGEDESKSLPPPYVHPLVKRSKSTLSQKSLEICTESLGSETGSEGFSSYPQSEIGDVEDDKAEDIVPERAKQTFLGKEEEFGYLGPKKAAKSRTFPPPLPSLSRENGVSLSMKSSRDNGRLVLEAVSVSSPNNFQAQRHEGRLILTFVDPASTTLSQEVENVEIVEEEEAAELLMELDEESSVFGEKFEDSEDGNEEEAEETVVLVKKVPNMMPSGVISVHKLAVMMNKPIGLPNSNPKWASKFNEVVVHKYKDAAVESEEEEEPISYSFQQSLPLQPQVARMIPTPHSKPTSSFNAYDYFWKTKPTTTSSINAMTKQPLPSLKNYGNNCPVSKKSSGRNAIYYAGASSCNEPRRSLFFWEPNCIATS